MCKKNLSLCFPLHDWNGSKESAGENRERSQEHVSLVSFLSSSITLSIVMK